MIGKIWLSVIVMLVYSIIVAEALGVSWTEAEAIDKLEDALVIPTPAGLQLEWIGYVGSPEKVFFRQICAFRLIKSSWLFCINHVFLFLAVIL
ncbi:MAG: hypothetical protein P9L92_00370 [Candidatus Electryonea clarkiae]|nr:hypothetical protein [Candidatus Electryonea clarkiae]